MSSSYGDDVICLVGRDILAGRSGLRSSIGVVIGYIAKQRFGLDHQTKDNVLIGPVVFPRLRGHPE